MTQRSGGPPMPCVMKFLAPEAMAAAVIGKGGSVIVAMRQSCNAKITLTDHGEVYPQTECRVLIAGAHTEEALNEVHRQIVAKMADLVKGGATVSEVNAMKTKEAIGSEGEIKIRTLVPRAAVGGVIGKGGATIKQIRETSGAKVSISEPMGSGPGAEQLVAIAGPPKALEYVLTEVNRQIQLLNSEAWFQTWAVSTGVVRGGGFPVAQGVLPAHTQGMPMSNTGIDIMIRAAQGLPPYVLEDSRGFALSCVVPNRLVGGLIGRGGQGTREVQLMTNTKIGIREIPDDPDNRSLNIAGPLPNTCAAYMLMMKRYLDAESQSNHS